MSWGKKLLNTPIVGNIIKKVVSAKANNDAQDIASHFIKFLQPQLVNSDELLKEVFKIRHEVYCDELEFLPKHSNGLENDDFDTHSIFSLIKHKPTDAYTSCIRIVKSSNTSELLPIEFFCKDSIDHEIYNPALFKREEICEISRLAVKSQFRRRQSDKFKGSAIGAINEPNYSEKELRCFPFIAIGLYMTAATLVIESGIKHVFVMMEPRLARSMKFVGIKFIQIGKPIDYHGIRAPYYISTEIFMNDLTPGFRSLYNAINKDVKRQL
jgi:N-acyl amino acid synthase of PEP-CTERM/exosortase system